MRRWTGSAFRTLCPASWRGGSRHSWLTMFVLVLRACGGFHEPTSFGETPPVPLLTELVPFTEQPPSTLEFLDAEQMPTLGHALTPPNSELALPALEPEASPTRDESGELLGEPLQDSDWDDSWFAYRLFGYRGAGHQRSGPWLIGNGDHLGFFTLDFQRINYPKERAFNVDFDCAIHWVMGPKQTDMPARLYDFVFRWNHTRQISDSWGYDLRFTLGFYSDFEGSARRGLRWPSTAVAYYRPDESLQWLLGVDILNRDDIFCLPVAGAIWTPRPDLRLEFVFPQPRASFRASRLGWLYVAGEIGGGMWAVERASGLNDVVTYHDYRVVMGLQRKTDQGDLCFSQIGVALDRHLEFRSGQGNFDAPPAVVWQFTVLY